MDFTWEYLLRYLIALGATTWAIPYCIYISVRMGTYGFLRAKQSFAQAANKTQT